MHFTAIQETQQGSSVNDYVGITALFSELTVVWWATPTHRAEIRMSKFTLTLSHTPLHDLEQGIYLNVHSLLALEPIILSLIGFEILWISESIAPSSPLWTDTAKTHTFLAQGPVAQNVYILFYQDPASRAFQQIKQPYQRHGFLSQDVERAFLTNKQTNCVQKHETNYFLLGVFLTPQ